MATPQISVIICHHTGDLVTKAINSIYSSINVTFEIIVVSSDINFSKKYPKVDKVLLTSEPPAKKRNDGAYVAQGKYLAFFDDDVEVEPDCLYELKKCLDKYKDCGMVYGKLYNMEHRNRFDEAGGFLTWTGFIWSRAEQNIVDEGQYDWDAKIFAGKSASCMIKTETFYNVGEFDIDFGILGEESDLSWRVWLGGECVMFAPKSVAYHAFNTKFKPVNKHYTNKRIYYNGCRNYITMLIKNLGPIMLLRILPIHISIWFASALAFLLTLKFKKAWCILAGLAYIPLDLVNILEKRYEVQRKRVVRDKDLFLYIYKSPKPSYYLQRFFRYIRIGLHG